MKIHKAPTPNTIFAITVKRQNGSHVKNKHDSFRVSEAVQLKENEWLVGDLLASGFATEQDASEWAAANKLKSQEVADEA